MGCGDPDALRTVLAAEVLKLSFIRQLKNERLVAFAFLLTASVVFFVVLIFVAPRS